jgi:hypothetical protein
MERSNAWMICILIHNFSFKKAAVARASAILSTQAPKKERKLREAKGVRAQKN